MAELSVAKRIEVITEHGLYISIMVHSGQNLVLQFLPKSRRLLEANYPKKRFPLDLNIRYNKDVIFDGLTSKEQKYFIDVIMDDVPWERMIDDKHFTCYGCEYYPKRGVYSCFTCYEYELRHNWTPKIPEDKEGE